MRLVNPDAADVIERLVDDMLAKSRLVVVVFSCVAWVGSACSSALPPSAEDERRAVDEACSANPKSVEVRATAAERAAERFAEATRQEVETAKQLEADRAAATKERERQLAELEKAIRELESGGLITRMDGGARSIPGAARIYVDGPLWAGFKVDQKEDLIRFLSRYRDSLEGRPQVELIDDRSGRELASYGPILGISLK